MSWHDVDSARHFWSDLFEEEKMAAHLDQIAVHSCHLVDHGDVQVKVEPATKLGDGYMSDAYLLTAMESSLTAFVKVITPTTCNLIFIFLRHTQLYLECCQDHVHLQAVKVQMFGWHTGPSRDTGKWGSRT